MNAKFIPIYTLNANSLLFPKGFMFKKTDKTIDLKKFNHNCLSSLSD